MFFNTTIMTVKSITDVTQVSIAPDITLAYYIANMGVHAIDTVAFDLIKVRGREEVVISTGDATASDTDPTEYVFTVDTSDLKSGDTIKLLFKITDDIEVVHTHYSQPYEVVDLSAGS